MKPTVTTFKRVTHQRITVTQLDAWRYEVRVEAASGASDNQYVSLSKFEARNLCDALIAILDGEPA